jgi:hypothetical protein
MSDTELAAMLRKRHQHINQTCRMLASQRLITADNSYDAIVNKISGGTPSPSAREARPAAPGTEQEWAWEAHVHPRLAIHLATNDWSIIRIADTGQRERGVDIIAGQDGQRLLAEVEGRPSSTYARGGRAGQPKPTQPTLQPTHWFAAVLTSLIRRAAEPGPRLAMGLPDTPRYRTLLGEAGWALARLDITVYLATRGSAVEIWKREK